MSIDQFRQWLRQQLASCDHPDPDLDHYEDCAETIRQAGRIALNLGLPLIYQLCRIRSRAIASDRASEILGECLAALPTEPTATITVRQLSDLTGWSRTTIWRRRQEGTIPEPRTTGGKMYWLRSELSEIL